MIWRYISFPKMNLVCQSSTHQPTSLLVLICKLEWTERFLIRGKSFLFLIDHWGLLQLAYYDMERYQFAWGICGNSLPLLQNCHDNWFQGNYWQIVTNRYKMNSLSRKCSEIPRKLVKTMATWTSSGAIDLV